MNKLLFSLCIILSAYYANAQYSFAPEVSPLDNVEFYPECTDDLSAEAVALSSYSAISAHSAANGSWSFGGSFGMSFGNYTNINISPQVGYNWAGRFTLGGGIGYSYYNHKDRNYTLNFLGANVFARYYPISFFHLLIQPEVQRRWGKINGVEAGEDVFACLLLGGGVSIPAGYRSRINFTVYYDVIQNRYTPYGNNIGYSVGFSFGF